MADIKHLTNFLSVWIMSIMSMILPIIIMLFLGRCYKVEEFGNYCVAASFISAMSIFLTFGLGNVVSYETAAVSDRDHAIISELLYSSLVVLFGFSLLGVLITAISVFALDYNREIITLSMLLGIGYWSIGANSVLSGVFMGIKQMHLPAVSASFAVLTACLVVVTSLYLHLPLWIIALTWSLSQCIGLLATGWFLYQQGFLVRPVVKKRHVELMVKRSLGIGLDSVISRFGANITNILLPVYLTSYQIGLFNGASKPFVLLSFAGECCLRFFSPYIAGARYEEKEKIENYISVMHKLITFFTLTMIIIPVFFSAPLVRIIFGEKLMESVPYMAMLAFGYLIYYYPPQSPPLLALGHEWKVLWCSIVRLAINVVGIIILIPRYGLMGAVIALNISFAGYWLVTSMLYYRERIRPINKLFGYVVFTGAAFLTGYIVQGWVSNGILGIIFFLCTITFLSLFVFWDKSERFLALAYAENIMKKSRGIV